MFPMTPGLRAVLERQRERTTALEQAAGRIIPWVFHRNGKPIKSFRGLVPRSTAMRIVDHKTESIYRRYAIVDEAMSARARTNLRPDKSGTSQALSGQSAVRRG